MTSKTQQRNQLRKTLRHERKLLDAETQLQHAMRLAKQLSDCDLFKRSKKIAVYLPEDGEIDPGFLIHTAWRAHKKIYLPVLAPFSSRLYFAPYTKQSNMQLNRFQIAEPDVHPRFWLKPQQLDLILMPLVGFDEQGNRLGMGGGFYDRSLQFTRYRKGQHSPYLVGLAHQLQQVNQLPHEAHDIPMQMLATEQRLYKFI